MVPQITLGDMVLDVAFKNIKNVHLSVNPPTGRVRISAPLRMNLDVIRAFAISKIGWIRQQQKKMQSQERETPREYLERESHYVWGKRYLLTLDERDGAPNVELSHRKLVLQVRPGSSEERKRVVLEDWYRQQVKVAVPPLVAKWERLMGVTVNRFFVQRMKTKWGSCNHRVGNIRLNTELAKKPKELLEYVIVHEMAHLLEPTHNERFIAVLDKYFPSWREARAELNDLPLTAEAWKD